MAELIIKPNDLQGQIDSFKTSTEAVGDLEYKLGDYESVLQSVEDFSECVTAMNELIAKFVEFAKMDAQSLQQIKAEWMHADSSIATQTVGEIMFGTAK